MEPSEAFRSFLAWLGPDEQRAGERYNEIHTALVKVFVCRGCDRAAELADVTLDRVIKKIDVVAPGYEGNPAAYVHGVAKKVFLEYVRTQQRRPTRPLPDFDLPAPPAGDRDLERRHACLEACLAELLPEERSLILGYYQEAKRQKIEGRQALAGAMEVSSATLRKKSQRIRDRLKTCLLRRLTGTEAERA
jgi:DNA-directed RNA polymerase specialized sigma24 family protein